MSAPVSKVDRLYHDVISWTSIHTEEDFIEMRLITDACL